jgi:hypothetical protein
MKDCIAALHAFAQRCRIRQVARNQIGTQSSQIFSAASGSHQQAQIGALLCQQASYMATDESRRSSYKRFQWV